ncbi:MAG: response regulator, partial [Magnetococcales bacterium]|nr:response regulator [Magnetococcales bacterium]
KIEAGQLLLEHVVFDVVKQVEDACETMAINAQQKQLELFCYIENNVPLELVGDPLRFRQILINLINNAIKFTQRGEVVVRVQNILPKSGQTGHGLKISVADTGIGIAPDKLGEIFKAFTQADGSTTRRFGGTGLGLSISRRLVAMMGGEIWVESREGAGSVFYFTAYFSAEETRPFSTNSTSLIPKQLNGIRVLVFDLNLTGRHVISNIVQYFGAEANAVDSWEEFLEKMRLASLENCPFDMLIADISVVKQADVWDFLEKDRSLAINTVWLKPMNMLPDAIRVSPSLTNTQHVNKPIRRSSLLHAMRQALGYLAQEAAIVNRNSCLPDQKGASIHILLVEDQVNNQKLAMEILHNAGHQITLANDGMEAMEVLASHPFDLVLMDLNIPKMDGFEIIRRIRNPNDSGGVNFRVPIVVVTATILADTEETCAELNINGYLLKPYLHAELLRAIEPFTRRRRPQARKVSGLAAAAIIATEGDRETVEQNRNLWIAEVPKHLTQLEQVVKQQSVAEIMSEIHWFQDVAANIGAARFKNRVMRLKGKVDLRDWPATLVGLRELTLELEQVSNILMTEGDSNKL